MRCTRACHAISVDQLCVLAKALYVSAAMRSAFISTTGVLACRNGETGTELVCMCCGRHARSRGGSSIFLKQLPRDDMAYSHAWSYVISLVLYSVKCTHRGCCSFDFCRWIWIPLCMVRCAQQQQVSCIEANTLHAVDLYCRDDSWMCLGM